MQIAEQFDVSTLAWVKGEIDETLKQARIELEAYVSEPDDESHLASCLSYIHQVFGTLQMVELHGAAMFAEELEKLAQALKKGGIKQREQCLEVLMRAILQLPEYLEGLLAGRQDNPITLLPLLNEMRGLRGEKGLSEANYFDADLTVEVPARKVTPPPAITTQVVAKKVHPYLMQSLSKVIKGVELAASLKTVATVIEKLLQVGEGQECRRLLWVASAFLEGLRDASLPLGAETKPLLGKIEQQVRVLVARGEAGLDTEQVSALLKAMLYQLAHSTASGGRATAVKQAFQLDSEGAKPGALSAELKRTVSSDIMDELERAKDVFDIFVRGDRHNTDELQPMVQSLATMADTLSLLQEDGLCGALKTQVSVIEQLLSGTQQPTDDTLMGVAGAILAVESALSEWGNVATLEKADATDEQVDESEASPEATAEHQRVTRQVMKEARDDLIRMREAVNGYLERPDDKTLLEPVPTLMHLVIGSLKLLSYKRVAQILAACGEFVDRELIASAQLPVQERLDALADAMMSIEYYLEAFVQSRVHPGSVLDVAESAIARMGYTGEEGLEAQAPDSYSSEVITLEQPSEAIAEEEEAEVAALQHDSGAEAQLASTPSVAEGSEVDDEIVEIFIEEAEEELQKIGDLLPRWSSNPGDLESLRELRRSFHTLKGSGRLVGATELGEFAWAFENMLNQILDGKFEPNATIFDMLAQTPEVLNELIQHFRVGTACGGDAEMLRQMAEEITQPGGVSAEVNAAPQPQAAVEPLPELDPVLLDIYSKETQSHLDVINGYLQQVEEGGSRKVSEPLIRALHTLKGSSNMAGIGQVSEVSASLEKYCKTLQALQEKVNQRGIEALQQCVTYTTQMLAYLFDNSLPYPDNSTAKQLADEVYAEVQHLEHVADAKPEAGLASVSESSVEFEVDARESGDSEPVDELSVDEVVPAEGADELLEMALDAATPPQELLLDSSDFALAPQAQAAPEVESKEEPVATEAPAPLAAALQGDTTVEEEYDPELLEIFLEEGAEILDASEHTLQEWVNNPTDRSLVEELQRQLHTLKGGARMAGITPVGNLSHSLESTFEAVVDGLLARSPQMIDLLQLSHDRLVTMLEQVRNQEPVSTGADLISRIDALAQQQGESALTAGSELQQNVAEQSNEAVEITAQSAAKTEAVAAMEEEFIEELTPSDQLVADSATSALGALEGLLAQLAAAQTSWQRDVTDSALFASLSDAVDALNRASHESAVEPLVDIADAIQVLTSAINDGHVTAGAKVADMYTLAQELMHQIIVQQREGKTLDNGHFLITSIRELIAEGLAREEGIDNQVVVDIEKAKKKSETKEDSAEGEQRRKTPRVQQEMVRVRSGLLDDLVNFAGEVSIYRSRIEQQIGTFGFSLEEMDQTISRLREQLRQVEIETEAQIDSRRAEAQKQGYEDFDPLEFDRFTNMQTLSRSMAESLNDLLSIEGMLSSLSRETETLLLQQSRVNTELQENLMHTRMVPISESAPRLRRVVRQTASELDKRATLSFDGAEVEMDRNVVERMMAPLEHMLRNSIAHGIEDRATRKKAGKPEEGSINIALSREGSEIVIRVSDDGGGINLEVVKQKAIDRGLMKSHAELSDQEIMHFILESGFSTAASLTQVAGRGVGMDVVNSEIKQLGGVLEIESDLGKGTQFTVRLPLTLSVSRALLVTVQDSIYAIPLPSISGIERIAGDELETLLDSEEPSYTWLDEKYNLMHLTNVLGAGQGLVHLGTKQPLLMTNSGGHRVAFAVDGLLGSREIVVKSLGPQLSTLQDLAGATILADGSIALIIDMASLVRRGLAQLGGEGAEVGEQQAAVAIQREPVVMVVDDSITVRRVTERLLLRNNMKCVTAKDGVDAISVLDEIIPDVMLLDIEMPRMDGYELATHIRNSERLKQIPIIMITSRTGDKHRQRAMDIGVNEYMGKPYTEVDLMNNIEKQLGRDEGEQG